MAQKKETKNQKSALKISRPYFLSFLVGLGGLIFLFALYNLWFFHKIYPRVYLGGEKYGGLTKKEATAKLNVQLEAKQPKAIILSYKDVREEIPLSEIDYQPDIPTTVNALFKIGRRSNFWLALKEEFRAIFLPTEGELVASYNKQKLEDRLNLLVQKIDQEAKVLSFRLQGEEIVTEPSQQGKKIDKEITKKNLLSALGRFQTEAEIAVNIIEPKVGAEGSEEAKEQFKTLVFAPLSLSWEKKTYSLSKNDLQEWAVFREVEEGDKWILKMDLAQDKIAAFLKKIAKEINQEPVDARLTITDGVATVFHPHQDGYQLDEEATLQDIKEALSRQEEKRQVNLRVKVLKPNVRTDNLNDLGIKELIGEGTTSFAGSPKNRITNITVGANIFNGVLIKPGEEFSFNKVLGEVSERRGFVPELVIKEDKLIPETGGGLCQVSTTMFRAALNSGLDITARTPHAFRVRYYEPPVGLDATVYSPNPDLKFINDTPAYIIIQTVISGTKLTFQFYGTKDGRTVKIDGPYTSDYKAPGPPIYIDDPSLPAGKIVQIEKAVPGITARVHWVVYKDGKVLHEKTFVSKYVAWRAKYKRGTGAPSVQAPAEQPPAESPPPETPPVNENTNSEPTNNENNNTNS